MNNIELAKAALANRIFLKVWEELQSHKGDETEIYYHKDKVNEELNYIGFGEPIKDDAAKELIMKQIQASLENHGRVCIYTCRDNGCISLDWPEDENDLEVCDVFEDIPELYWAID